MESGFRWQWLEREFGQRLKGELPSVQTSRDRWARRTTTNGETKPFSVPRVPLEGKSKTALAVDRARSVDRSYMAWTGAAATGTQSHIDLASMRRTHARTPRV